MEGVASRDHFPRDEYVVSGTQEHGAAECKREGNGGEGEQEEQEEDSESEEGVSEGEEGGSERESESEEEEGGGESEDEDYSSGRGCHLGISVGGMEESNGKDQWAYNGAGGYGDGDGDGQEPADGDRMLWVCGICNVSVNIFARDDHIISRSHIRAVRKLAGEDAVPKSSQIEYLPMWRCAVCDEEMSVFLREEHIFGKQHLRMFRKQQIQDGPSLVGPDASPTPDQPWGCEDTDDETSIDQSSITLRDPDMAEVSSASYGYKLRGTFYCITCAAEFDLSMEELHLPDAETWGCSLCSKTMHPAMKEIHLESEGHLTRASEYESQLDFQCEVCRRFYSPIDKERHLAGKDHQQMAARRELERRYMKHLEQPEIAGSSGSIPGAFQPHPADKVLAPQDRSKGKGEGKGKAPVAHPYAWTCGLCGKPSPDPATHREWHCPLTRPSRDPPNEPRPPGPHTRIFRVKGSKSSLYCDICRRELPPSSLAGHLQGKKHLRKAAMINGEGGGEGKAGAKAMAAAAATANIAAGTPAKTQTIKKQMASAPEGKQYCDVCNKFKRAAGMADHMRSKKHKKKAAAKQALAKPQTASPSTQVAQPRPALVIPPQLFPPQLAPRAPPQPAPVVSPQPAPVVPPQPAPAISPQLAPRAPPRPALVIPPHLFPPQLAPRAPPQPAPVVSPQPALKYLPQPAPQILPQQLLWGMSQPAPSFWPQPVPQFRHQMVPRVLPQMGPPALPQWASWNLPQAVPQVPPQPAPRVLPQLAPQAPTTHRSLYVSNIAYMTIIGDRFYCKLCKQERPLVGIESHIESKSHKMLVAAEGS